MYWKAPFICCTSNPTAYLNRSWVVKTALNLKYCFKRNCLFWSDCFYPCLYYVRPKEMINCFPRHVLKKYFRWEESLYLYLYFFFLKTWFQVAPKFKFSLKMYLFLSFNMFSYKEVIKRFRLYPTPHRDVARFPSSDG